MNASAGRAVLVGVDGSSAARRAAVWAAAFASRTEAPLRRVHVLPEALYLMTDAAVMGQGPAIAQHRAAGQRFLDDASTEARLGFPGVDVHTGLVPGPTAPALAAAGATSGMIVLGAGTPSGVGARGGIDRHRTGQACPLPDHAVPPTVRDASGSAAGRRRHRHRHRRR